MGNTFSERLQRTKNILAGVAAHSEMLTARGISAEAITQANALLSQTNQLDNERNALKARSQEATAKSKKLLEELERFCSQVKTLVRMDFPKETWPEFGFREGEYAAKKEPETAKQEAAS